MTRHLAAFALALLLPGLAQAQLFRAYLSIEGSDANPCTLVAPCRLLGAALNAVADGGEIWMLDSGNFNTAPMVVDKSVTILAIPGALGSLLTIGGPVLQLFPPPGARVTLRNIEILPLPGYEDQEGIFVGATMTLILQGCTVRNFTTSAGVHVLTNADVFLIDSTFTANRYGVFLESGPRVQVTGSTFDQNLDTGILAQGGSSLMPTRVAITRSTASRNGNEGFAARGSGHVEMSIVDSSANHNGANGVAAAGGPVRLTITGSQLMGNANAGVLSAEGARVTAAGNSVTYNGIGFFVDSIFVAALESLGTNLVQNNAGGNDTVGTITPIGAN
jgi:nitrous oxidase accessory protein NosD